MRVSVHLDPNSGYGGPNKIQEAQDREHTQMLRKEMKDYGNLGKEIVQLPKGDPRFTTENFDRFHLLKETLGVRTGRESGPRPLWEACFPEHQILPKKQMVYRKLLPRDIWDG